MVCGSLVVGACLLVLGWTSEIVGMWIQDPEWVCDPIFSPISMLLTGPLYCNRKGVSPLQLPLRLFMHLILLLMLVCIKFVIESSRLSVLFLTNG
jgi:hypothetical protein